MQTPLSTLQGFIRSLPGLRFALALLMGTRFGAIILRRLWPALLLVSWVLLYAVPAFADSQTWMANPGTGNWNTTANWVGGTVPNGIAEVATFDGSSVTDLSLSSNTTVNSIVFNAAASPYAITASPTFTLTLSGAGIVNNSGNTQSFIAAVDGTGGMGTMIFGNTATAGSNTLFTTNGGTANSNPGGTIEFQDSSNAGSATFILKGSAGSSLGTGGSIVGFFDSSSAANATFFINGPSLGGGSGVATLQFHGNATAANGTFTNNAGPAVQYTYGGVTFFYNNSTAANGVFTNYGGTAANAYGGATYFDNLAHAANGTFTNLGGSASGSNGGKTYLSRDATMDSATFINNASVVGGAYGGATEFYTAPTNTTGSGNFINQGGAVGGARGGNTIFHIGSNAGNSIFTNNGGTASSTEGGTVRFYDNSSAGSSVFANHGGTASNGSGGGVVFFYDYSSADTGVFNSYAGTVSGANGGAVVFNWTASAGNATFNNQGAAVSGASAGSTQFFSNSSAGKATIMNGGGTGDGANGADTPFYDYSRAGSSTIINQGGTVSGAKGGITSFKTGATAETAMITANAGTVSGALGGITEFLDSATAGNATLIANGGVGGGGAILFAGDATGGKARVKVYGNGNLDISQHNAPGVAIGSIEGSGNVFLGARTLTVGTTKLTTTLSGVIQDGGLGGGTVGKLTKIGSGTLTLTGANIFTGTTAVNGGTLVADTAVNATVLSSSSTLAIGGGTFQLKGNSGEQSQALVGLTVNAGASVVDVNNLGTSTTLDLGGTMTRGAGGTVDFKASGGTFGTDALIKTTQANVNGILGGWATVNGGAAFATKNASNVLVAYTGYTALDAQGGGSNSTIANSAALNYGINASGLSGNVSLAATTTSINTLTQNFSTASTIDTAGKALRVGVSGGIFITPTGAALTIGTAVNSGTLTSGTATNGAGEVILNNSSSSALTINSTITNNGTGVVSLTKSGAGLAVINGTNTFTGSITLNSGTLTAGNAAALGAAGRTLRLTGGTLDLATDTSVNAWNTTVLSAATILSDKATASSAGITHTLGTLSIGAQTLSIGAGPNVAADSNFGITFGTTTLSGDSIFNVANNGADIGTLTLGRVTDGGVRTITKTGAGTLIFATAASTSSINYGTAFVINNGVAQVNVTSGMGSTSNYPSVTVNATTAGATALLRLNNVNQKVLSLTLGGAGGTSTSTSNVATGTGILTLDGDVTFDATGNPLGSTISGTLANGGFGRFFNVGDSSNAVADLTISANITGNTSNGDISLIKTGAGTLVLSGTNTFNRGISLNAGRISVASLPTANLASSIGIGTFLFSGGTLEYTGGSLSSTHVFRVETTAGGGGLDITQAGTVLTISSAFTGAGSGLLSDALVKSGTGTLVLSGNANNTDLDVAVSAGKLLLSKSSSSTVHAIGQSLQVNTGGTVQLGPTGTGNDQILDDAIVTVNTGGTFDFNAKSEAFDGLRGGGSITNTGAANSTMTVGAKNHLAGTTTFSGVISDGVTNKMALTKSGRGTQILTGTNTFTGTTTISGGALQIGDGGTKGSLAGQSIVNHATLAFSRSDATSYGGVISGTGSLRKMGSGILTLSGDNTYTGATLIEDGILIVDGSIASDVMVQDGATFGGDGFVDGDITLESGSTLVSVDCFDAITLVWNAEAKLVFSLSDGFSDILELSGNLAKMGSGTFGIEFVNADWQIGQTYTLITFGDTDFIGNEFSFTNGGGFAGTFALNETMLEFTVTAVPEPGTFALLVLGLGALLARRR